MTGRGDLFHSVPTGAGSEPPHDTEDLVRLIMVCRQEKGWTQDQLANAAGVESSEVGRFEAQQIVPAKPLAMRRLQAMGHIEPGMFASGR